MSIRPPIRIQRASSVAAVVRPALAALLLALTHSGAAASDPSYEAYQRLNGFSVPSAPGHATAAVAGKRGSQETADQMSQRNYRRLLGFPVDTAVSAPEGARGNSVSGVRQAAIEPSQDPSYRAYRRRSGFSH